MTSKYSSVHSLRIPLKKFKIFSDGDYSAMSKFALLSSIYPPDSGGPATFTAAYKNFLTEKGFRAFVISYSDAKSHICKNSRESIRLISRAHHPVVRLLLMVFEIWKLAIMRIPILANGCFIELAIATLLSPCNFTVKIPGDIVWERASSKGMVNCSVHDFQSVKLPFNLKILRFLFTLSLRKAKIVLVPAPYLVGLAISWGVDPNKIVLIYNGVDIDTFRPIKVPKTYDVITVSRLVPVKNIEETIKCCARLNLRMLVVGDGPLLQSLKHLAKEIGANVTFAGNADQSQLPSLYNESRIMVLNSSIEATSYSLLEARACGLPAIANLGTGATEVISHNRDGFLCGDSTGMTLEDALLKLTSDHHLAALYGENAREDTVKRFNRKKIFHEILVYSTTGK